MGQYQRIVRFKEIKPGDRFACSRTGTVYVKFDIEWGEEERGQGCDIFQLDHLVYTDLPTWCCFDQYIR